MEKTYLTVAALTKYIKAKLESDMHLSRILIKGEISNFTDHSSGHLYFTLKDEKAQIKSMMFSSSAQRLGFKPKNGDQVLIEAGISVYEPHGTYSLVVYKMEPAGIGNLFLEYNRLKAEYEQKGYFDQVHKRPIPRFNYNIGVVTSPTGAVIEDIKNTVNRRFRLAKIILYPASVQGEKAVASIVAQISKANQENEVSVLIVGRGGGSLEDLWAFNDPKVIEAIFSSKIPIIAAIGHETDFTISDFVASLRAPTPTAAAEMCTPNKADLIVDINRNISLITHHIRQHIRNHQNNLMALDSRLHVSSPLNRLAENRRNLNRAEHKLNDNYRLLVANYQKQLIGLSGKLVNPAVKLALARQKLNATTNQISNFFTQLVYANQQKLKILNNILVNLNPLTIMDRGFTLTKVNQKIVTSITQVKTGDEIELTFKDGIALATIEKTKEKTDE